MNNSWICVDANLVLRLVADPTDKPIQRLWEQWDSERRQLAAPTLLYYEVANALYRYQNLDYLSASSVQLSFRAALALPLELHGGPDLHWRALGLAQEFSLPAGKNRRLARRAGRRGRRAPWPLTTDNRQALTHRIFRHAKLARQVAEYLLLAQKRR